MKSYKVIFYGKVQGVGFRATCAKIARELKITGYVKNLEDGSVEALFNCEENNFKKIIERLREIFEIRDLKIEEVNVNREFEDFDIWI